MLSFGTFSHFADSIAFFKEEFISGSAHSLAAIEISFACFVKTFHLILS
jgi:hypothetical protein